MKLFVDTANIEEIRKANDMGVICGVTTNPSLIAKEGRDFNEVIKDINYRDAQDSGRAAAPLRCAEDAVLVDTSDIGFDESFALLCELVITRLAIQPEERQ